MNRAQVDDLRSVEGVSAALTPRNTEGTTSAEDLTVRWVANLLLEPNA